MQPIQVFSKEWFELHQDKLLKFANSCVGRRVFRLKNNLPKGEKLVRITPESSHYHKDGDEYVATIYGPDMYAYWLYQTFKPMWWSLHFWDWLIADRFRPMEVFSAQFDTLTVSPAAGANSPIDGDTGRVTVDETLTDIRAGAGNTSSATGDAGVFLNVRASTTTDQWSQIRRPHYCFDTSSIGASATVSAADFKMYFQGAAPTTLGITPSVYIVESTIASTSAIADSDYGNVGSTSWGNLAYASYVADTRNAIAMNATGYGAINKTGITKIAMRHQVDFDGTFGGTWASNANSAFNIRFADIITEAQLPQLTVTYSAPTTSTSSSTSISTSSTSSSISTSSTSSSISTSTSSTSSSVST